MFSCPRLLLSITFFSLLLASKLEGLQECIELLDFLVSNVCHLVLNGNMSFSFCLLLSVMLLNKPGNLQWEHMTQLSSRSWGLKTQDISKYVHKFQMEDFIQDVVTHLDALSIFSCNSTSNVYWLQAISSLQNPRQNGEINRQGRAHTYSMRSPWNLRFQS